MTLIPVKDEGHVVLCKREPAAALRPAFRLHPLQGVVLALLDGERGVDDVVEVVAETLGRPRPQTEALVGAVLGRYRQFVVEGALAAGESTCAPAACIFPPAGALHALRDPAPSAMLWVVTDYCNKNCRYCFRDAVYSSSGSANDMVLPFRRLRELAEEAADIGVTSMTLTGGEPFLRPDLTDVIAMLVEHGIDPVPITKMHIPAATLRALATTGLRSLHVSLDSHRPEEVDFLTGIPGAFTQIVATVAGAAEAGVNVVLRPTLTSRNLHDIVGLMALADELGVSEVLVALYGQSCGRHEPEFLVTREDHRWLYDTAPSLRERHPRITFRFRADEPPVRNQVDRGCAEAARGLTMLPDGRATKCEHWRFGDQLILGDLRVQSIMELWQSTAVTGLLSAPREAFAGTACQRCKQFDACNDQRGRCTLTALENYGTPFAPDCYCPIGAYKPRVLEKVGP